jgi:ankyrin repeat protein
VVTSHRLALALSQTSESQGQGLARQPKSVERASTTSHSSLHPDSVTMAPPEIPLELLLMIAHHTRDDCADFNSFLQVNRALYACLNHKLWKEAAENEVGTQRALTHLIKTNNLERLELFLELGADIEARLPDVGITEVDDSDAQKFGGSGPTPLIFAADLDNVPVAQLLLANGAQVEYSGLSSDNLINIDPIHAARSAEMVQLLLRYNANPNGTDELERSPLHWYVLRGDIAAMREILLHGAEVSPDGPFKPIYKAVQCSLDAVILLVEHGADVEAMDDTWGTLLHFAAAVGMIDVVRFLLEVWPEGTREKDKHLNTPLNSAVALGWGTELVGLLVEGCPEAIREKNQIGDTPLHSAARMPNTEVLRLLVERWPEGKDALNYFEQTPFSTFEGQLRRGLRISDEEMEEIVALLS